MSTDVDLLLVRHAQSAWNADGRWQGHADPPLSPLGVRQATALAAQLADESVDVILSSDLQRAQATARALAAPHGLALEPDPLYRELDIGAWSGLTREQIAARDAALLERFDSQDPGARPPRGETRGEIRARARRAIESLVARPPGARVVVVTHLGFIRALVPGAQTGNAEVLRASGSALLALRLDAAAGDPAAGSPAL